LLLWLGLDVSSLLWCLRKWNKRQGLMDTSSCASPSGNWSEPDEAEVVAQLIQLIVHLHTLEPEADPDFLRRSMRVWANRRWGQRLHSELAQVGISGHPAGDAA